MFKGKIIQITGSTNGELSILYALTDEGVVYQLAGNSGWVEVKTDKVIRVVNQHSGD